MMNPEKHCRDLAQLFLREYRLSREERVQEMARLALAIQRTIEAELENLEHRRVA